MVWRWEGWRGARVTLSLPNGHWWELGWNPAIRSYFAQLYSSDRSQADPDLMQPARFGTEETPITSVAQLEELLGGPFPNQVRQILEAQRRERPEWRIQLELGVELPEGLGEQLLADRVDHLGVLSEAERAELADRVEAKRQEMAAAS